MALKTENRACQSRAVVLKGRHAFQQRFAGLGPGAE